MPNRIVRDGMLESEAVLSLPPEGRWLYVSILLSADDYGLFEATTFKLAKKADIKREHVAALLQSMVDADLVRLYRTDLKGIRVFGFVTKFGQRFRIRNAKHPLPPMSLLQGEDEELVSKFKELGSRMSDTRQAYVGQSRPETETETETETEKSNTTASSDEDAESTTVVADAPAAVKKTAVKTVKPPKPVASPHALDCPQLQVLKLWQAELPELPQHEPEQWSGARADHLRSRWREAAARDAWQSQEQGLRYFCRLFRWLRGSPFLMGQRSGLREGRPFRLTLEWLVKPANYAKVLEGHYHDEGSG